MVKNTKPSDSEEFSPQDLDLLAKIATDRSGKVQQEAPFRAKCLLRTAADSWTSITPKGRKVLQDAGYEYLPKGGWTRSVAMVD